MWTTTPSTLPLNRAVLVRPGAAYVVLDAGNYYMLVGKQLADTVVGKLGIQKKVVLKNASEALVISKVRAQHPFIEGFTVPVLKDSSVSLDEGTALVIVHQNVDLRIMMLAFEIIWKSFRQSAPMVNISRELFLLSWKV